MPPVTRFSCSLFRAVTVGSSHQGGIDLQQRAHRETKRDDAPRAVAATAETSLDLRVEAHPPPPIFILSALPRTGTNFLWEVLRRHPDCIAGRSPIWEDYLLKNAGHLELFAREAQASWDPVWGSTEHLRPELLAAMGEALTRFLSIDPRRRTVTKSPTIANLDLFFDLFPRAHLVLLIRDGRDVTASGMKTFGWTLEEAARGWALGAAAVSRFAENHRDDNVMVVRFEDLVVETRQTVSRILAFLGLDVDSFDPDSLDDIPVRGSSAYLGPGRDRVNWDVLARPEGFAPIGRWQSWSANQIATFEEIAGAELEAFGYPASGGTVS